jgi:hypothetical protein
MATANVREMLWSFISSPEQRNPKAMMVLLQVVDR